MSIQQMLLATGGANTSIFTIGSTSYDLATADCTITSQGYYQLTVPAAGVKFKLFLWGAAGANGTTSSPTKGSAGGYAYGEFELDEGTYVLLIGDAASAASGGFPDGGNGTSVAGGGGGSTRFGPNVANSSSSYNSTSFTYYLIAGGGGGGTNWGSYATTGAERGEGGGTDGGDGGWYYTSDGSNSIGKGGSQSVGGAYGYGGRMGNGTAGIKYHGGNGGSGGGGGGYYGGGGGAGYYAQGGGGSGYINTSVVTNGVLARGGTGSSLNYYESYHGPNNEKPSATYEVGDAPNGDGAAVFKELS